MIAETTASTITIHSEVLVKDRSMPNGFSSTRGVMWNWWIGSIPPPAAMVTKLYWATWHRDLGELAMDVLGPEALLGEQEPGYELTVLQRLFLFTRSDTIYAGSNQIQRNIIGERALGLPKEPSV